MWCIISLYLYLYIYIFIHLFVYIYIYRLCNLSTCKRDWIVFDVIYFVHQQRDETFLTKPRGTWKGVVVLIVATHRSTQGFRQFDGSLLSCGNIRTWWKRSVAPLSSGKILFRHVGMIYIYIYISIYADMFFSGRKGLISSSFFPRLYCSREDHTSAVQQNRELGLHG